MDEFLDNRIKCKKRRRAALVLLIIGVLCLNIDIRMRTNYAYPDYEFAEHYGAVTQRMIMEDVVGTRLTVDLASELLGYLSLFVSLIIVWTYAKPAVPMKKELKKLASKFGWLMPRVGWRFLLIPLFGAIDYVTIRILPYFVNGIQLYGPEYFLNFGLAILCAAAVMFSTLCFLRECDRFQNHKETQLIYLFTFLTVFTGLMKDIAAFYGLNGVRFVYMILNTVFVVVMCAVLVHYVYIEEKVERQAAEAELPLQEGTEAEAEPGEKTEDGDILLKYSEDSGKSKSKKDKKEKKDSSDTENVIFFKDGSR